MREIAEIIAIGFFVGVPITTLALALINANNSDKLDQILDRLDRLEKKKEKEEEPD